jgi:DNA-binding NarL/FixJ family response regulator
MSPVLLQSILADDGMQWLVIGCGMLAVVYFVLRPMAKRKDPTAGEGPRGTLSKQRSVEREMSSLLVELSEMSRQITGQLDTRATKLELLLKEADEKIEALRAASAGAVAPASSLERREWTGPSAERRALLDEPPEAPRPSAPPLDPRHAEVYALADAGRNAREIAADLGRPSGEVELILALRPRT